MYVWVFSLSKIRFYKTRLTYNCAHLRLNNTTRKTRKNCPRMVATLNLDPWQKVRQPLFRHFRPFLEENIFWPKTLLPPPLPPLYLPKEGIMVPKNQPWCQHGANHGANHGAMVPTNFLAISDHFWKKIFFGKKISPLPPSRAPLT